MFKFAFQIVIVLLFAAAATKSVHAQVKCKRSFFGAGPFEDAPTTIIKWTPIFAYKLHPQIFTLEQRIGSRYSVSLSLANIKATEVESNIMLVSILPHLAAEISHRLYPVAPLKHGYLQAGTWFTQNGDISYSFGLGLQEYLFKKVPIDFNLSGQTSTPSMQFNSRWFFRAGLGIGLAY